MTPKIGEVFIVDLGYEGKVRPVVVVSREDPDAPRALSVVVPLTSQFRESRYEVKMPRVPWLNLQSFANVQAIGSLPSIRFEKRLGVVPPADLKAVKAALLKACAI